MWTGERYEGVRGRVELATIRRVIETPQEGDWLWLDDLRPPPDGYRYWAKTVADAILYLETGAIVHCSLDHDLAEEHLAFAGYGEGALDRSRYVEKTGYAVLEWMHEHNKWCPDITIHTMNPVGRRDMVNLIQGRAPAHIVWRVRMAPIEPAEHEGES